jgi:hypothetical protein
VRPEAWRAGSLTLVAAPLLVIAVVIALLGFRDNAAPWLMQLVGPSHTPMDAR